MNRRLALALALALLPVAAALMSPPELVLPAGERIPYPTLPKESFARSTREAALSPGRNIFLVDPPARPKDPVKPPEPVKVKVVTPEERAELEARRLESTRRVSGRFTLLGYHAGAGRIPDRAFLAEEGTVHILLVGSTLHDRFRLESVGTASVLLRDLSADRLEEVRFRR